MASVSVHLSFQSIDDREIEICKRYWAMDDQCQFLDKLPDIARRYGLTPYKISTMQARACTAIIPEAQCISCETRCTVANRTAFAALARRSGWVCGSCAAEERRKHEQNLAVLATERAARQRAFEERQRAIIQLSYVPHTPGITGAACVSLREAVFLVGTLRCSMSEHYAAVTPPIESSFRIAPHENFAREVLTTLLRKGLICVSPDSPLHAFRFDQSGAELLDPLLARYNLSLAPDPTESRRIALEIEARLRGSDWPTSWNNERRSVAKEIAIETCVGYLLFHMEKKHLRFSPGHKTRDTLAEMLDHFSMSQCFAIIWRSVVGAVNYMVEHRVSSGHAANSVVGNMKRRFQKAVSDGWEIADYRPEPRCCDCSLTELLLNDLQRGGTEAFFRPLNSSACD